MNDELFMQEMLKMASVLNFPPKLNDPMIAVIWYEALKDLTIEELRYAVKLAIQTQTEFPKPATLRNLLEGNTLTFDEIGQKFATDLEGLVASYGHTAADVKHPLHETLQNRLGEFGRDIVQTMGGWAYVCAQANEHLASWRKQVREFAIGKYKQFQIAGETRPIGIPQARNEPVSLTAQRALKLIKGA